MSLTVNNEEGVSVEVSITETLIVEVSAGIIGLKGADGIGANVEIFNLTEEDIETKKVHLSGIPQNSLNVELTPYGGLSQRNGVDYTVSGNMITWDGLGLDSFLDITDTIVIRY
jgi:hypothetical protein